MRVLIFGSTGMLGSYAASYLSSTYNTLKFNRKDIDVTQDIDQLYKIINKSDIVINCIGVTKPNINKTGRIDTIKINTIWPQRLADICRDLEAHMIHISTDCIYSGMRGSYNENDYPDAPDLYARTKSIEPTNSTIIRTSFIGEQRSNTKSPGLLQWILNNKHNVQINGYINALWNGVTCLQLVKTIEQVIKQKMFWTGPRHIYSNKSISKYELCQMVNDVYNLNLIINPFKASEIEGSRIDNTIDRTLTTIYNNKLLPEKTIQEQLIEQKHYKI